MFEIETYLWWERLKSDVGNDALPYPELPEKKRLALIGGVGSWLAVTELISWPVLKPIGAFLGVKSLDLYDQIKTQNDLLPNLDFTIRIVITGAFAFGTSFLIRSVPVMFVLSQRKLTNSKIDNQE